MGQLSEFERSYTHVLLYPPQPVEMLTIEGRRRNFSTRMYGIYLEEARSQSEGSTRTAYVVHVRMRG